MVPATATLFSQNYGTQSPNDSSIPLRAEVVVQFLVTSIFKREGPMFSPNDIERVYSPDTLKIMAMAFDNAHKCLPEKFRGSNKARHKLALLVMRYIERGERDPVRLADSVVLDFLR